MLVVSDFNGTLSHGSPIIGLVGWVGENQSKLRKNIYMAKQDCAILVLGKAWVDRLESMGH